MKQRPIQHLQPERGAVVLAVLSFVFWTGLSPRLFGATSLTQNGVTWTSAQDCLAGTFCNGEFWIKGPVTIVDIRTDLHAPGFTPKRGQDGSMVNPGTTARQGYDSTLASYDESMNAGLPNGRPVAPNNPLILQPNQTLISMVSWLYHSAADTEPGCPGFNGGTKAPRPVTRSAAILTCLDRPPPDGSFRPIYCGTDKAIKYQKSSLKIGLLQKRPPVGRTPSVAAVENAMSRTWVDHVNEFLGAMVHPSEHMPNYGRDMTNLMNEAALMLHLDFDALPGKPSKDKILINLVQYGIDLAGIADHGGGWPANGGHSMGRKWPILFAGLMLDDVHLKDVGQWKTRFQEDEQTFFVSQQDVAMTHSRQWAPDARSPVLPYEKEHIGMPEWGIRHREQPQADNRDFQAMYRSINGSVYPGFVLAAQMMGQKKAWNHDALFDYTERYMALVREGKAPSNPPIFVLNMWIAYGPAKGVR